MSPLHFAISRAYTRTAKCLIDNGADINARTQGRSGRGVCVGGLVKINDAGGWTALHLACHLGLFPIAQCVVFCSRVTVFYCQLMSVPRYSKVQVWWCWLGLHLLTRQTIVFSRTFTDIYCNTERMLWPQLSPRARPSCTLSWKRSGRSVTGSWTSSTNRTTT